MKVKDAMKGTPIVCCTPDTTLQEAARMMEVANCGVLPVLDEEERVIGIVTDRDICLSLGREFSWSHSHTPVYEIMTEDVHCVNESENLTSALKKMRVNFIGRLPVVDKCGRVKGMLSIHDLFVRTLLEHKDMGHISSSGENIVKTVKALSDRYAVHRHKEMLEKMKKSELNFVL
jgi:CBS domain-containing protein